jgi:predicted phosphoribosyltransferase
MVGLLFVAACSSGPEAPAISSLETVCNDAFCVDVPDGWEAEVGDTYLSFHHSLDPIHTFLTVGVADMEAIVVASGGTWPVSTEEATRSFWSLLEDVDVASFKRSQRLVGGAYKSWGTHTDGDMWYLLYPVQGSRGIGIEMRAPNGSWETHADAVFNSLVVIE